MLVEKVIDAKILLLKDVDWGIRHLPYGYEMVVNDTTYKYLKHVLKNGFRVVIDNDLEDYVVKFEEVQHA